MNHMTPTGIKGLDLYCLQDGKWLFAGSGRPQGKVNEATIVKDMLPEEREYLLFLSLYDGGDFSFHRHRLAVSNQRAGNGTAGYVRSRLSFTEQAFCREAALPVRVWRIPISWSVGSIGNVSIWDLAAMLYWIWRLPM